MRKFFVHTFGCQMNVHDAETLSGLLEREGLVACDDDREADVVLIETCSVRQQAEDKVWSLLGRLGQRKEHYPDTVIAVIGCMAEKERETVFKRAPHVDIVAGPRHLDEVPALISERLPQEGVVLAGHDRDMDFPSSVADRGAHPWSAYVAVSRGCSNACAYCIVPSVRGPEVSRSPDQIMSEVRELLAGGAIEITLLGQNVDAYGRDLRTADCGLRTAECGQQTASLAGLVRELGGLQKDGLRRLRFVTSHPKDINEDLLRAMAETPVTCPFLHMPAQSGSDAILKAMRRGYDSTRYRELVAAATAIVPDVEIASDFIVGFPGETDADFEATLELVRDARFQRIFGFRYSPRPGTYAAENLEDDVPFKTKRDRLNRLFALQTEITREHNESLVGRAMDVLVEGPSARDETRLTGRTRGWRIVTFPDDGTLPGQIVDVRIERATALSLLGERV